MLSINNVTFYFGSRTLYEEASLHIHPKNKIGLIGANGTGKSTLLKLITGEYQPDEGSVEKSKVCTIGFLNQDLLSYQTDESILEVAMQAFARQNTLQAEIEKVLHQMETNYKDELVDQLARLQEEFEALDGYTIKARAEEVLEGLGFRTVDLEKPLKQFSGGWRMRVMLAKLLLEKPSLLMLDEPTNHLDLPSIEWVEKYLKNYEGAVIVVSHDRDFLNNVIDITVEVSQRKLTSYSGNYTFYLKEKALRQEIQQNAYENQQDQIKQMEKFITRFRSKATKARQVQSRIKQLEKMDLIEEVIDEKAAVHFKFSFGQTSGRQVIQLKDVSKAFGENKILENTSIQIERGDKIALIGANGKGKSTLLRIIAGTEPIQTGEVTLGHNVIPTFFAQHQLEALTVDNTMLEELQQAGSGKLEAELRTILGCFLFSGDDVFKKIKVLSGGEKSRVALAKTLISEANFLLLDEPTNHLDMQSVNILIQALEQYEGTYIVISHDRHFVRHVANKIWYIENQEIKEYLGTYDEYEYWQAQRTIEQNNTSQTQSSPKPKKKKETSTTAKQEQALKKAYQVLTQLEEKIARLEEDKQQLEQALSEVATSDNPAELNTLNEKYQQVQADLSDYHKEWEQQATQIEMLENA
ncbi:MAG: ABC-F family ATP-binding cassette domain-containing protein [Thermonemataceae bacterium]